MTTTLLTKSSKISPLRFSVLGVAAKHFRVHIWASYVQPSALRLLCTNLDYGESVLERAYFLKLQVAASAAELQNSIKR